MLIYVRLRDKRKCAAEEQQRTEEGTHSLGATCYAQGASQGSEYGDENFEELSPVEGIGL